MQNLDICLKFKNQKKYPYRKVDIILLNRYGSSFQLTFSLVYRRFITILDYIVIKLKLPPLPKKNENGIPLLSYVPQDPVTDIGI